MNQTPDQLRCSLHIQRVAAARCMSCGGFFCHECITEHDLRMLCAPCLRKETVVKETGRRRSRLLASLVPIAQLLLAILLLWVTFYLAGRLLIATPSEFHEGTMWEEAL